MRMYYLLSIVVLLTLVNCGVQADQSGAPQDEGYSTVTSEIMGCTAHSDCTSPYNGIAVDCSGSVGASCTSFLDHVTCNGISTFCTRAPATTCAQHPASTCSNKRQCDNMCGGPGFGLCITSTACCVCL